MRIVLIAKPGHADSGVGRYTVALAEALRQTGHQVLLVYPRAPLPYALMRIVRRGLGWDLGAFFDNNPLWAAYPPADIYHLTSQNLASMLLIRRPPGRTVVTVHDIIPWLVRDNPELNVYHSQLHALFDRLALWGLKRADHLIADSSYSAVSLAEAPDRPLPAVTTVNLGVL